MEDLKKAAQINAVSSGDRILAAVGYLPFLCLVPLLTKKGNAFIQLHAKQGFLLFAIWIALHIIGWFPVIGWIVWFLGMIAISLLALFGIYKAATGERWEMPVLGGYAKQLQF